MRSTLSASDQTRTFTEQARRSQIVGCAIDTMIELGYARSSLTEIAKRAGIGKGLIAYHFANKDELTEQVVLELYRRVGQLIEARTDDASTAAGALRGYLEANLAFIQSNPDLVRVLTDIIMNFRKKDGGLRYGPDESDGIVEHLSGILRRGQDAGEFRDFPTRPMAIAIRAAIDAASGRVNVDPTFDIDIYSREMVTMFDLATAVSPR